ncbi:MAG: UDP-3-O-(3-hydroxymyristoyl)glucosamine N-acyltransferase, partial [Luteimonas sp.]
MTSITAGELASRFGLQLRGDGGACVEGVNTLASARTGQLTFLANPRYRMQLADTQASVVVLRAEDADDCPATTLVAEDPYSAFARIAALFEQNVIPAKGVHASAAIDPAAMIDPTASIGPFVSIGPRTRIHAHAVVGPGCVIGEDCTVGEGCELVARVTLVTRVTLGKRVRIHAGAVLGADGFGLAMEGGRWLKVPQLGGVRIGDDCEIGANTTIDRGALDDT